MSPLPHANALHQFDGVSLSSKRHQTSKIPQNYENRDHDGGAPDTFSTRKQSELNRSKTLQIDAQLRPRGPLRPSGTIYGPECLHLATELYRLARPSYFTSKYPTFDLHGPPHTNESQKVRRHRIREGRFGGFPASRGPFSSIFDVPSQKTHFQHSEPLKNRTFSIFFESLAPQGTSLAPAKS